MTFDAVYDNKEKIGKWAADTFEGASKSVGDAVSGGFSSLGSAFGF